MALLAVLVWPMSVGQTAEKPAGLPGYYPQEFTFVGCIQQITPQQAVIGDILLPFAPAVSFNTPKEQNATREWFRVGHWVGVVINSKHMIESLWYLDRQCRYHRGSPVKAK